MVTSASPARSASFSDANMMVSGPNSEVENIAGLPVIQLKNVTLKYPIHHNRSSIKASLMRLFSRKDYSTPAQYVTAMSEMNLEIRHGERVALIGHNGAGKSTLLRALAGIYPHERGEIFVKGRIGTLLDINLGFESEATGRENIYHRGLSMGLSRKELQAVESEIIDFAQLGEFIDYPLRTYSTGMQMRLGFAVSTQFAPDILLVDEVFGAGDAAFSQKALTRMMEVVARSGALVLASHDEEIVRKACTRGLWIANGKIREDGPIEDVLDLYHKHQT